MGRCLGVFGFIIHLFFDKPFLGVIFVSVSYTTLLNNHVKKELNDLNIRLKEIEEEIM